MGKLGNYDIEAELGRGSMGVVYLAHDSSLKRRVALKTVHVPAGVDRGEIETFRERFLREAQAAGGISHPGIVTIYGVDESPEEVLPFISMEYVPGPNLRQILKREGRLDPQRAFHIADALADALHTAHAAGVIHRDIKPANVLVRETDGAVKIADFGVAHLALNELTRSGELVGSPAYMSPEQIRGGDANACSDLFSLGVMLYEMLAGVRPFAGSDMAEIVHQVVYQDPAPITKVIESLPGVINAFFDRALAKSPRDRFQTGAEFRQALNDVQLEYQINHTEGIARIERPALTDSLQLSDSLPRAETSESGRHSLRQYMAFFALFALFLIGWAFWSNSSDAPQPAEPAQETVVGAAGEAGVMTPDPLPLTDDAALGESVLTEDETLAGAAAAEMDPEAQRAAVPKPAPKKRAAPAKRPAAPQKAPVAATEVEVTDAEQAPNGLADADDTATADPAATEGDDAVVQEAVVEPAQLTVVTKSALKQGFLTLFVDGEEALFLDLASGKNAFKRFYKKALSRGTRNEAGVLDLSPGPHEILVHVIRPNKRRKREASIQVDLAEGEARSLEIVAGRLFGSGLVLRLN